MSTDQIEINIDEIIAALPQIDHRDRARLQDALAQYQNDLDLKEAIEVNLEDIKSGRVSSHQAVMKEINEAL